MPKITSKQSKELKCLALLGEPSPEIIAWVASKRAEPGTAKARALERLAASQLRKARVAELMRLRQASMCRQTILFSDGYVRVGAESMQRIAEAAEKRAADRAAMEEWVERERKVARLINLRNQGKENRKFTHLSSYQLTVRNGSKAASGSCTSNSRTSLGKGSAFDLLTSPAFDHLVESWGAFLHTQSTIVQLELDLTMAGPAPFLPALKTLIARAESAAQILERNSVAELILSQPDTDLRGIPDDALGIFARAQPGLVTLRLGCGELLALMNLPNVCVGVVNLILDGDGTWEWDRQLRTLRGALSELRKSKSPALRTLRLVAWDRQPSARNVFKGVRSRSVAGRLSSVHYCNEVRGCHHWARSKDELGDEAGCDFAKKETPSWMEEEDTDEDVVLPPNSEYWDLDDSDRELSPDSD
ncbi:hypothetical protein C8J57DRAFT_1636742, partial [Mycena rebaudengoi]